MKKLFREWLIVFGIWAVTAWLGWRIYTERPIDPEALIAFVILAFFSVAIPWVALTGGARKRERTIRDAMKVKAEDESSVEEAR